MRILQIDKFLDFESPSAGGVGRYISVLSGQLRNRGHEVEHFGTVQDAANGEFPQFYDYKKSHNPFALFRMIREKSAAKSLQNWLAGKKFDIAHLHNIYHHLTPAILPVLKRANIPAVLTLHDYRLACPTRHFYRKDGLCTRCLGGKFYHAISRKCAGLKGIPLAIETTYQQVTKSYSKNISSFICPTEFMKSIFEQNKFPTEKLKVVRNIVAPIKSEELVETNKNILYVGRLSYEKGSDLLVDIADRLPDSKIIIAGDGPEYRKLSSKIASDKLTNVELLGHVAADEIAKLYRRANIIVVPSRCMENSPASLLEAMQAGRIVIAPDQPEIKEWIVEGKTGFLFKTGDQADLLRACKKAIDSQSSGAIATAARQKVLEMNDLQDHIEQIIDIYQKATCQ